MDILPPRQIAEEVVRLIGDTIKAVVVLALWLFLAGGVIGLVVIGWRAL